MSNVMSSSVIMVIVMMVSCWECVGVVGDGVGEGGVMIGKFCCMGRI